MKKMTIGIFAPSSPAHILFASKYKYAKSRLLELGFNVKERVNELIDLILDEDIDILMLVIGGYNSANLLSNLDFDKIKNS